MITVLLADDHFFARIGIAAAVNSEPDLRVIAEAANGCEAVQLAAEHQPDIIILDGQMPGLNGIEAAQQILMQKSSAKVLIFSIDHTDQSLNRAVDAGVKGYLPKSADCSTLIAAIRNLAIGRTCFTEEGQRMIFQRRMHGSLSPREIEVLEQAAQGLSNKQIGEHLGIAEGTVKIHMANALAKLDAPDRTRAVTMAMQRGILRLKA